MAPKRESLMIKNNMGSSNNSSSSSSSSSTTTAQPRNKIVHNKLPRLSMESLQRTISDISLELLTKQALNNHDDDDDDDDNHNEDVLPAISEAAVEEAKCECCGMAEECTGEYVGGVRAKFGGRMVCGLCAEAVAEEMEKKGAGREEALRAHMSDCSRFNKLGRTYPSLFQAQAVKEILKKSSNTSTTGSTSGLCNNTARAKSLNPRDYGSGVISGHKSYGGSGLARSSSCIPAIIRKES